MSLAFEFLVWVRSFLAMFGGSKNDSFTFVMASQGLLSGWIGCLKFCAYFLVLFQNGGVLPR